MNRIALVALLGITFVGTAALVGCDREISHDKTVKTADDGTVKKTEKTVKEKPDGTVVKEEHKSTDNNP
jgi:hypothetical protein